MKILYIAPEREAAAVAARALHGIAQTVAVTWAQTPGSALQWLQGNRDAAAVLVEVQAQTCGPFVEQLRGLGLTTPVVVVAGSSQVEPAVAALNAGIDGYVVASTSFEADLARVVLLAIEREHRRREPLTRVLAELDAERTRVEQGLARAEEARQAAEELRASELAAAAAKLADIESQHRASLAREARICTALQQRLFELESAVRNAEDRSTSDAVAFADQLASRHAEFTASLAQTAHSRDVLAAQLSAATAALDEAHEARRAEAAAAIEHLRQREVDFGVALAEATAARAAVEAALDEARAAHRETRQRGELDRAAATERHALLEETIVQESDRRADLEEKLAAFEAAQQEADRRHLEELTQASERLADVQARYDAALEEHAAARADFDRRSGQAAAALEQAARDRAAAAAAAAEQLARREAELGARIAEADAANAALEQALSESRVAHQHDVQRAATDLTAAAAREAALEDRLAQGADTIARLERELVAAQMAREVVDRQRAEESAAAAARFANLQDDHDAAIRDHASARGRWEQQWSEAIAAHADAQERAAAAISSAAAREAELVERLASESGTRARLERDLADLHAESTRGRGRLLYVVAAHRRRSREELARVEAQMATHRAEADRERRASEETLQRLQQEHETLRERHATAREQLDHLQIVAADERRAHEHARLASESELQRLTGAHGQLRHSFDSLQSAFQSLERIAGEHAAERARLEGVVADRDTELSAQAERHRTAEQAAQEAFARLQQTLHRARDTSRTEIMRLERGIESLRRELEATRTDADALRREADRIPDLRAQLDASQRERRREFERAPYGLCRCTRAGVITDANHSFVALLGRRRVEELRDVDFAAAVFDCAGDLRWLLERTQVVRKTEPVEASWKTKDGRHLTVRLQALATPTGLVEIAVEDITDLRAVEERLRHAQRMEAVGRLASEVAVTCDALLGDVTRGVHDWLTALGGDEALRRQGERLLADVTRAATFLRQLGVYGQQQVRSLERVSVQRVLRDLAPVLKRVVGDRIELVLSKSGGSFDVDVEIERLERVLVNVAAYARQRMPRGGQMRIDLATTAVGRRFVARYPNVRPGDHVLITVTELPGDADRPELPESVSAPRQPGVDLGTLVDLVGTCGGHLWMEAQPAGNMMVKIHLPKPAAETSAARSGDARSERGHRLTKWFRSPSTAGGARA